MIPTIQPMLEEYQEPEDEIFQLIRSGNVDDLVFRVQDLINHSETQTAEYPSPLDQIVNAQNKTPLQYATEFYNYNCRKFNAAKFKKIIEILLMNGANPNFYYSYTKSPRELNDQIFTELGY